MHSTNKRSQVICRKYHWDGAPGQREHEDPDTCGVNDFKRWVKCGPQHQDRSIFFLRTHYQSRYSIRSNLYAIHWFRQVTHSHITTLPLSNSRHFLYLFSVILTIKFTISARCRIPGVIHIILVIPEHCLSKLNLRINLDVIQESQPIDHLCILVPLPCFLCHLKPYDIHRLLMS